MNKKSIKDVQVKGKKCLVRVDFNVPMKDGVITITINNLSATDAKALDVQLSEAKDYKVVEASVLTHGQIQTCNTFDEPENVKEEVFKAYEVSGNTLKLTLPALLSSINFLYVPRGEEPVGSPNTNGRFSLWLLIAFAMCCAVHALISL